MTCTWGRERNQRAIPALLCFLRCEEDRRNSSWDFASPRSLWSREEWFENETTRISGWTACVFLCCTGIGPRTGAWTTSSTADRGGRPVHRSRAAEDAIRCGIKALGRHARLGTFLAAYREKQLCSSRVDRNAEYSSACRWQGLTKLGGLHSLVAGIRLAIRASGF